MAESTGREGQWSEAERSSLILQVLSQWKPEKGGVNWEKVHLEGRTRKAMQNVWCKITGEMKVMADQLDNGTAEGAASTTTPTKPQARKRATPKKKAAVDNADGDAGGAAEDGSDVEPPKKKRTYRKKTATKAKVDGSGDEDANEGDADEPTLAAKPKRGRKPATKPKKMETPHSPGPQTMEEAMEEDRGILILDAVLSETGGVA